MNLESSPQELASWRGRADATLAGDAADSQQAVCSLEDLLGSMAREIRALVPDRIDVQLGGTAEEQLPTIALSRAQAQDLIRHLVIDAVDAMPGTGTLAITGVGYPQPPQDLAPGRWVVLSVCELDRRDSRPESGQPPSYLDKGRALGLSAAYEALERAGGYFTVSRREGETAVHIYFPASEPAA